MNKDILDKLEVMIDAENYDNFFFNTNILIVFKELNEANDNLGHTSPIIIFYYKNYPYIYNYWNLNYDLKEIIN